MLPIVHKLQAGMKEEDLSAHRFAYSVEKSLTKTTTDLLMYLHWDIA